MTNKHLPLFVVIATLAATGAAAQGFGPAPSGGAVSGPVPEASVAVALLAAVAVLWRVVEARRAAIAVVVAAVAFFAGDVGAIAALALGLVALTTTKQHAAVAAVGVGALAASMSDSVVDVVAAFDLQAAYALLGAGGITAFVDGMSLHLPHGELFIAPACAAVEGTAVAFVIGAAVQTLLGASPRRVFAMALAQATVFAAVNVVRIATIGVALTSSFATAELVHELGALLMIAVHVPFLIAPFAQLARRATVPNIVVAPLAATRIAGLVAAVVVIAMPANAAAPKAKAKPADAVFPIAGVKADDVDVQVVNEYVVQRGERAGFKLVLRGAPSSSNNKGAAIAALKKAHGGRALSGTLKNTGSADEPRYVLETFIVAASGKTIGSGRAELSSADDKSAVNTAVDRALTQAKAAVDEPEVVAEAAPVATPVVVAAPVAAPVVEAALVVTEPVVVATPTMTATTTAEAPPPAPAGPSFVVPVGLAVGAVVAGGGAVGSGLWAQSDVDSLRAGTSSDPAGTRGAAVGKAMASDVLSVGAIALGAGAIIVTAVTLAGNSSSAAENSASW